MPIYNQKILAFVLDTFSSKLIHSAKQRLVDFLQKLPSDDLVYLVGKDFIFEEKGAAVAALASYPFGKHSLHVLLHDSVKALSNQEIEKEIYVFTDVHKFNNYEVSLAFRKCQKSDIKVFVYQIGESLLEICQKFNVSHKVITGEDYGIVGSIQNTGETQEQEDEAVSVAI